MYVRNKHNNNDEKQTNNNNSNSNDFYKFEIFTQNIPSTLQIIYRKPENTKCLLHLLFKIKQTLYDKDFRNSDK